MKNRKLWLLFGTLYHILSWVLVLVYGGIVYMPLISAHKLTSGFIFAGILALFGLRAALKEAADNGFGVWARVARAIRAAIPVMLGLVVIIVLRGNIGSFWNIAAVGGGGFLAAQPFGVLSYYYGPAHLRDTGINKLLEKDA